VDLPRDLHSYTLADIGPSVIGDPQPVADHVRYVGYRVVAMPGRSDLALRREVNGITRLNVGFPITSSV